MNGFLYDLIFISETWLTNLFTNGLLLNNNMYDIIRCDRVTGKRGGGVCLFTKKGLRYIVQSIPEHFAHLELICVDIVSNSVKHRFITVYRPPSCELQHSHDLIECMSILCDVNYSASVVGDFNFPIINWAQDFNVCDLPDLESEFVHLFLNFGFVELIKECTRGENILDLLFFNDPLVVSDVVV